MTNKLIASGAGRYAPSPSGELHLGNLRTAVLAWLTARSSGRAFLMRIEDLDRARDSGSAEAQLRDLQSLGIDWDDKPVIQSERTAIYEEAVAELRDRGLVYECFCTRKDVLNAPTAPHAPPGSYPGTCRSLTARGRDAAVKRISPRRPALRLRVQEKDRAATAQDLLHGEIEGTVDDLVLQRGDGTFAYNLAVVLDDGEMGIDQVVRGDDLLPSTPRQVYLQRLLGIETPEYLHVPLVLGPGGHRLAKRDGAVTMSQLRDLGTDASQVVSWVGASIGLSEPDERVDLRELLSRYDPARIPRAPITLTSEVLGGT